MRSEGVSERYAINMTARKRADSQLLNRSKSKNLTRMTTKAVSALVAAFMLVSVVFVGVMSSAPSAEAGWVEDGWNELMCGDGAPHYGVGERTIMTTNTGDAHTQNFATPYEKYGMSGLRFTTWIGFSPNEGDISADEHGGKGSSVGIINNAGGTSKDSGLTQWESATQKDIRSHSGLYNIKKECSTGNNRVITSEIGQMFLEGAKATSWFSGLSYRATAETSSSIYTLLEGPVESIVTNMKDKFYFNYLTPMIMIGALWMAYVGLVKRRSTEFLSGLIWTIAALAASVVIMSKPMLVPTTVNSVVTSISQGGMATITGATSDNGDTLCAASTRAVSVGAAQKPGKMGGTANNNAARNNVREIECNLWYSFAYTPWTVGQFGMTPQELSKAEANDPNGFLNRVKDSGGAHAHVEGGKVLDVLKNTEGGQSPLYLQKVTLGKKAAPDSEQNWALYLLDHNVNWDGAPQSQKDNKVRAQLAVAANQLAPANYNVHYHNDSPANRIGVSLVATLGSLAAMIFIVTISFSIVILDLMLILLALVSPIFFLAALHPGMGRKIAMGWVEMVIKAALQRIALSIFLAVMVATLGIVVQSAYTMGYVLGMVMVIALCLGAMKFRKQVSDMFNGFSLGGQSVQANGGQGGGGIMNRVAGLAMGAATGNMRGVMEHGADRLNSARSKKGAIDGILHAANNGGAGQEPVQRERRWEKEQPNRSTPSTDVPASGAGEAPQSNAPFTPDADSAEAPVAGAGGVPFPTEARDKMEAGYSAPQESVGEAPKSKQQIKQEKADAKMVEQRNRKRLDEDLNRAGYRSTSVSLGTVMAATAKGALVGAVTGSGKAGYRASSAHIETKKQAVMLQNQAAISRVRRNEMDHSREMDRRNAELEKQKRADEKKAAQDAARQLRESAQAAARKRRAEPEAKAKAEKPSAPVPPKPAVKPEAKAEKPAGKGGSAPVPPKPESKPAAPAPPKPVAKPEAKADKPAAPVPPKPVRRDGSLPPLNIKGVGDAPR